MASDFYKRTKDLFEEFQKREMQYYNAEAVTGNNFQASNMPVHEYLEKLNEREKETEDAYRGLMHHIEQLDHRTESITEKLRKLETLRMSMSSKPTLWPHLSDIDDNRPLYHYSSPSSVLKIDHAASDALNQPVLSNQKDLACASTQTDVMFCENCQFPIATVTEKRHDFLTPNNLSNTAIPSFQDTSLSSHVLQNKPDIISCQQTLKTKLNLDEAEKLSVVTPNLFNLNKEASVLNQSVSVDNLLQNTKHLEDKVSISTSDVLETVIPTTTDNERNFADEKLKENKTDRKESDSNLRSNMASAILDQSIAIKESSLAADIVLDDLNSQSVNENISQIYSEGEISTSKINAKESVLDPELNDKRSESPVSIGGVPSPFLHSENASAISDSDSFDGKEHLKESAAYQALLGNVLVKKKTQKTLPEYSESESEDEVEKALATATRKSSNVPIIKTVQEEKLEDSDKKDIVESKLKNEPRKSISLGKSQQLSKSTRKVLGLDTSSGSEGEVRIAAKPSEKIEEDSDEFDFYD